MAHKHSSAAAPEALHNMRHSLAHVLAQAVQHLWPDTQITIGPPIETGCYYDFLFSSPISDADFPKIEKEMRKIIASAQTFEVEEFPIADSVKYWKNKGQTFKVELVEDLAKDGETKVTHYRNVDASGKEMFTDLCRGGHVANFKEIPPDSFKITSLAGAYWRGKETNAQLTRIYVTAFGSKQELEEHLKMLEEAKKRDHRKLGKEMDLFSVHEEAGPGLIYWHPRGALMRKNVEDFWREQHLTGGYDFVYSPHLGKAWLWQTSGHLDFYRENMYAPMKIDEDEYFIKPMNCPFHIMMYKTRLRSYRELPMRWAELGTVYRYEKSGVLHGLLRVRGFTQDDAHIFCTPEQIEEEIIRVLKFSLDMLRSFGFQDIRAFLSTRPEKAVGEPQQWDIAQKALERAIASVALPFEVDEGGGAFYGPKIDLKIQDAIGREWQLSTIQFDFNNPERFRMTYIGEDGREHQPFMVHRALLGSIERFFGILIEHFAGHFPLWLAPVQAMILPVAEPHEVPARHVEKALKEQRIRCEVLPSTDSLGKRIREGEQQRVPYLLVIGDKEVKDNAVAVRNVKTKKQESVPLQEFIERTAEDVRLRRLVCSIG